MSTCPSCGRYVGPLHTSACPHCGARLTGRIGMRTLQAGALALAVLGLVLLWWFSTHSPIPVVRIGQAGATTNLAYVRIAGQVIRAPSYNAESGTLSFWVADDTGELLVHAYRATAQSLIDSRQVPFLGDRVTVEGTLRVRPDSASLTLDSANAIRVEREKPARVDIGQIDTESELKAVQVRGQVRAMRRPYTGLLIITLRDPSGEIELAIPEAVPWSDSAPLTEIEAGQTVEASGVVALYKDTPQVTLPHPGALRLLADPIPVAAPAQLHDLTAERSGEWAAVSGSVARISPFSAGYRVTLDDGTGRADIVLWRDVYTVLSPTLQLVEGAQIGVQGEVSIYRGAVEIIPELPADVTLIGAAPAPVSSPTPTPLLPTPLGQIRTSDKGKVFLVRGKIGAVIPFSKGIKYRITDGTGQVMLILWQEVLDGVPDRDKLVKNVTVEVSGVVDVYNKEIEVAPRSPGDVQIVP